MCMEFIVHLNGRKEMGEPKGITPYTWSSFTLYITVVHIDLHFRPISGLIPSYLLVGFWADLVPILRSNWPTAPWDPLQRPRHLGVCSKQRLKIASFNSLFTCHLSCHEVHLEKKTYVWWFWAIIVVYTYITLGTVDSLSWWSIKYIKITCFFFESFSCSSKNAHPSVNLVTLTAVCGKKHRGVQELKCQVIYGCVPELVCKCSGLLFIRIFRILNYPEISWGWDWIP